MTKKVYLAGPITGLNWNETESWRDAFADSLKAKAPHIVGYSPLREKSFLQSEEKIADSYAGSLYSSQKAILNRDFFDVQTSDAIVANFTGSKIVSIGTVMEIAWAYQRRIPIIIISEEDHLLHNHSMLREASSWWVNTTDDALDVLTTLFTP